MNSMGTWEEPKQLGTNDFLDEYLEYEQFDDLINETLHTLNELDVPSGYSNMGPMAHGETTQTHPQSVLPSHLAGSPRGHKRGPSGTAIFGYAEHTRELSFSSITNDLSKTSRSQDLGKGVSPDQLLKSINKQRKPIVDFLEFAESPQVKEFMMPEDSVHSMSPTRNRPQPLTLRAPRSPQVFAPPISQYPITTSSPLKQSFSNHNQEATTPRQFNSSPIRNGDYFVTNQTPKAYKFPLPMQNSRPSILYNSYSAKYLQELNQTNYPVSYVDDIEPLLDKGPDSDHINQQPITPYNDKTFKFVPIPVQDPLPYKKAGNLLPPQELQQHNIRTLQQLLPQAQQLHMQRQHQLNIDVQRSSPSSQKPLTIQHQQPISLQRNTFLPPPSPPLLSHGSPELQSSPEPQSPEQLSPSPSRVPATYDQFSSPVHSRPSENNSKNFYMPQFFSDGLNESDIAFFEEQLLQENPLSQPHQLSPQNIIASSPIRQPKAPMYHSSPGYNPSSLGSSPVKYDSSPIRQHQLPPPNGTEDDTVDANNTTIQLTPLKNPPITPSKQAHVKLEWSPVISPNNKESEVKRLMKKSVRRCFKKTSLLPPGELDRYWAGPDEDKQFVCLFDDCGKKFTRRYNVRSHIQTHLSDRPFACSYCPKKFVRQHDLNRHVKGHLETRYCKCPCGKVFARLDALKKHRERNICLGGIERSNEGIRKQKKDTKHGLIPSTKNKQVGEVVNDALLKDILTELDE